MRKSFFSAPFLYTFCVSYTVSHKKGYNTLFPKNYNLFKLRLLLEDASFYCDIYISCDLLKPKESQVLQNLSLFGLFFYTNDHLS